MKRLMLFTAMAAASFGSANTLAADDTGAWYVTPMGQYVLLDHKRNADDGFGYQLNLGLNFAPNWAAELDGGNGDFDTPSGKGLKLTSYSLSVMRKFMPDSTVRPYVLLGAGGMEDQLGVNRKTNAVLGQAGVGLLTGLGSQNGSTRLQLRTEAKYRREFTHATTYGANDPSDVVFGVGLQFSFGNPRPPIAMAPPPPPPPRDSDGDGVPDDQDRCPGTPAGAKVDAYGCEFDSDGDGVVDRLDQCPNTPHGTPVDAVGCPLDSDHDGVIDSQDRCPNTPIGDKVDSRGCTIKDEIRLPGVHFATDSAVLESDSADILDYAVATLMKYPAIVVEIQGHTDIRGTAKHNMLLSQRRAESVMKYLHDRGVTNGMSAKGYGKTRPIATNSTAEGMAENRRVVLKILRGLYEPEKR